MSKGVTIGVARIERLVRRSSKSAGGSEIRDQVLRIVIPHFALWATCSLTILRRRGGRNGILGPIYR